MEEQVKRRKRTQVGAIAIDERRSSKRSSIRCMSSMPDLRSPSARITACAGEHYHGDMKASFTSVATAFSLSQMSPAALATVALE